MPFLSLQRISAVIAFTTVFVSGAAAHAAQWLPYGPYGGDARSLAADPQKPSHLYLGTVTGWVYDSMDSGANWKRLARVGKRDDLVLDNIVVDAANSKHVLVGAWSLGRPDGGLFQSTDGGETWSGTPEMKGQSILALSAAPSDPKVLVAGTLTGIYRSMDSGATWTLISPPENKEIHEVESIAIDPGDPQTIYAGTWHLPWKTKDGGKSWANIKEGVIDDSDVFSIIVDPKNPKIVFASACSGIYKSVTGGELGTPPKGERFAKVQGIPSTARRTRVLMQDPQHQEIVFAGTTEGLYRTTDAGKTWSRTTGPEIIVNDVLIDTTDSKRVMLATDRGGVLLSTDGGNSFVPANTGFSTRQITAFVGDAEKPGTMYAGVVNDKQWGGVFATTDGGLTWNQQSTGLGGSDIFSLGQAGDGSLIAGTGHGIYRYEGASWTKAADAPSAVAAKVPARSSSAAARQDAKAGEHIKLGSGAGQGPSSTRRKATAALVSTPVPPLARWDDATVYSIVRAGDKMFAGTSVGMIRGDSTGRNWTPIPAAGPGDWRLLAADKGTIVAVGFREMKLSTDGGETWSDVQAPDKLTRVMAVAMDDQGEIWVGGHEGVYLSSDSGRSWQTLNNLYVPDVDGLFFDPKTAQVYVASDGDQSKYAFAVQVKDRKVSFWEPGWNLRFVRPVGDHLIGATLFDGIVIQPRMVEAKEAGGQ